MAFTYFFRDSETLCLVRDRLLPELTGHRHIDIWDAGCATGAEPYSLAIILREGMGHFLFRNVRILATDADESDRFGEMIAQGIYPAEETARIPGELRERYFEPCDPEGRLVRVREDLRAAVRYLRHDLLTLAPPRTGFGVIVCKNVLLHFAPDRRREVIRMFHEALAPGGFLVTEHTQKMPPDAAHLFEPIVATAQIHRRIEPRSRER